MDTETSGSACSTFLYYAFIYRNTLAWIDQGLFLGLFWAF